MKITLTHTFFKIALILLLGLAFASCGQESSSSADEQTDVVSTEEETEAGEEDKSQRPSPPAEASGNVGGAMVTINYSAPGVKGREVWGGLVPFDEVWRTGANEATTFEVDRNITVNGQPLPAGRYALFTIPSQGDWTIIFNSVADQWGAYEYDQSKDVLRVTTTPRTADSLQERLEFLLNEDGEVTIAWENLRVPFSVVAE